MISPEMSSVLALYQRTASGGVLEYLEKQSQVGRRKGVYTLAVVFWLMILQRLQKSASQANVVQQLAQGAAAP
jgi:uncharacterized membrane protein (UPF0136 family)